MNIDDLKRQCFILPGVREHGEEYPVELAHAPRASRLCIRARNEGGNNDVFVDLFDLLEFLRLGPKNLQRPGGFVLPMSDETPEGERDGGGHGDCLG